MKGELKMKRMQEISAAEMAQVEGGFLGFLFGVATGVAFMITICFLADY
jgi:hypothetical protein